MLNFWSFIPELVTRNLRIGIPALEDGLFTILLLFDYRYYIFVFGKGKGKGNGQGKRQGIKKGKNQKGKGNTKIGRVPSCEVGSTVIRDYTVHPCNWRLRTQILATASLLGYFLCIIRSCTHNWLVTRAAVGERSPHGAGIQRRSPSRCRQT